MNSKTLILAFVLMFLSTFSVIVGDTGSKLLSDDGFSQLWVAWTRFAIATVILLPFVGLRVSELRGLLDWRIILRAALICCAISFILTAIKTEPMANAFGGFFISPIVSYILSWLFLREKISWQRSILLGVSFLGGVIVVRPGFGMTTGMIFAVLSGACHGTYLMTTRWLIGSYRPRFLLYSQMVIGAALLSPFAFVDNPALTMNHTGFLLISALGSAAGNMMLVLTNKAIPASVVAPLIYLQLISATAMGYLVFSQWPDMPTLIGLLIIIGGGAIIVVVRGAGSLALLNALGHR